MIFGAHHYPDALELALDSVAVARGERLLVAGITATLDTGTLAVISGPNGVGKSSLLRVVAGFGRAAEGEVRVDGIPVPRLMREQQLPLAYHGHTDGLKADLSVRANLAFYRRVRGAVALPAGVRDPMDALAEVFGLGAVLGLEIRQLSAGQRKRVALSRLLIAERPIWVLDEPYTNLDTAGRDALDGLLGKHLAAGGICLMATHLAVAVPARRRLEIVLGG